MNGNDENNGKELSMEHTFVLRLLDQCGMDTNTLVQATFSTRSQIQKILDELISLNMVKREWKGDRYLYKKA